jgi:hypothetical protein
MENLAKNPGIQGVTPLLPCFPLQMLRLYYVVKTIEKISMWLQNTKKIHSN